MAAEQKLAIYFRMAVGFWNFVGAGVLGFLINLPIVFCFEVGTTLTANHAHARNPEFTMTGFFHASEWIRIIGDFTFLLAGTVPVAAGTVLAVLRRDRQVRRSR